MGRPQGHEFYSLDPSDRRTKAKCIAGCVNPQSQGMGSQAKYRISGISDHREASNGLVDLCVSQTPQGIDIYKNNSLCVRNSNLVPGTLQRQWQTDLLSSRPDPQSEF
jgi:hypothetical protein